MSIQVFCLFFKIIFYYVILVTIQYVITFDLVFQGSLFTYWVIWFFTFELYEFLV